MAASFTLTRLSRRLSTALCRSKSLNVSAAAFRNFSVSSIISKDISDTEGTVNVSKPTLPSAADGALRGLLKFESMVEKVKLQDGDSDILEKDEDVNESFASMLRKSKLIAVGEEQGTRVLGKIFEVYEDDLYIDFGGKFHCVCPRPRKNGDLYQRGTEVTVSLKSQEMSSAFLGSDIHVTLLEADAVLLGLAGRRNVKGSNQTLAKDKNATASG